MNQPNRTVLTNVLALVGFLTACFGVAAIGGFATASSVTGWYQELNKPTWNPPNWIFGPVWTVLYALMAISAWRVWKSGSFAETRFALSVFSVHLIVNMLWSIMFFGWKQVGWAAIEIWVLWGMIGWLTVLFYRKDRLAALMMLPYLIWVSFAAFLNLTIWNLNR
ncbi:MAG: TspO/MBR family protein [Pirellulaceae bacterium]